MIEVGLQGGLHEAARRAAADAERGVGTTVPLSDFRRSAVGAGWIVAQVEAGADRSLREGLGEALHGPLTDLAPPSAGRRPLRALRTALTCKASHDSGGTWSFWLDLSEVGGGAVTAAAAPARSRRGRPGGRRASGRCART